jgi:DNA-binding transcriptional ArsR family regulator
MDLLGAAVEWAAAGFSVVPVATDGSKAPAVPWKVYQDTAAGPDQLGAWFGSGSYDGLGVVCGAVSGNLELLEVEGRAVAELGPAFGKALQDNGFGDLWQRLNVGYLETSPSGGLHWLFRVDGAARGNLKLARRLATAAELVENSKDRVKVLLETRGKGGFVVVAPSGGRTHPSGLPWRRVMGSPGTVPTITVDERDALYAVAAMFDAMPNAEEIASRRTTTATTDNGAEGKRPGDEWNERASWDEVLDGWTRVRRIGNTWQWVRPGKSARDGISATTGRNDADNLYVFSSSTEFEPERPYSKFAAYTLLQHGGDYSAAARELRARGYGSPLSDTSSGPTATVRPAAEIEPMSEPLTEPEPPAVDVLPVDLDDAHKVFCRWLGKDYDVDALDTVLAAAAVERLDGDPLWLLLISGSGNAKTETVQALDGVGAIVTSSISSEGALLSATSRKDRSREATGGLLRRIGDRGLLVIKDVTSILSMDRLSRGMVLAALRELYDGRWSRSVGTDGGQTLEWAGRITVVGAVTTAWDQAHAVIASMGDRFVLLRMDSGVHRKEAGRQAIGNTGHEQQMRAELAEAVAGVLAGASLEPVSTTPEESEALLAAADLVTRARTGVEYDYKGDVVDAHAPEMPTRFAKQLAQVLRGAVAVGMDRTDALRLAIRCARDSMPPLRLLIFDDVSEHPESTATDVRKRLGKPRSTVDRQLQALQILGVLICREESLGALGTRWLYSVAHDTDTSVLRYMH